jgi:hypothetical protein
LHRDVSPRRIFNDGLAASGGNDFGATLGGAAKVGAEARENFFPVQAFSHTELEKDFVADEAQEAFAGRWVHGWIRTIHLMIFTETLSRNKPKGGLP